MYSSSQEFYCMHGIMNQTHFWFCLTFSVMGRGWWSLLVPTWEERVVTSNRWLHWSLWHRWAPIFPQILPDLEYLMLSSLGELSILTSVVPKCSWAVSPFWCVYYSFFLHPQQEFPLHTDRNFCVSDRCKEISRSMTKQTTWVWSESLLSAWRKLGWLCWGLTSHSTIFQSCRDGAITSWVLSYPLSAQWRLIRLGECPGWPESSLGARSFCWFCHVMA